MMVLKRGERPWQLNAPIDKGDAGGRPAKGGDLRVDRGGGVGVERRDPGGVRAPRWHEEIAEEGQGAGRRPGAANENRLRAGRMTAGGHDTDAGEQLDLALGPPFG